jgi:hypothetical protein
MAELDVMFEIPTGGPLVSFHFIGSAERAGGAAAKNEKLVTVKVELLIGVGGNVGAAKMFGELGGYVESCSDTVARAFEQISYATYRRFRESSAIPKSIPSAIWGMGGESGGEALGLSAADTKRMEAEEWALGVEKRMADADRDADDGTVGKGAYVEGGIKAGMIADIGDGAAGVNVHAFTGRHMRPEGGGEHAAVPSAQSSNVIASGSHERRGRGVHGVNFGFNLKVGGFGSVDLQVSIKRFELLPGEPEANRQMWVAADGMGKVKLAGVNKWAAVAMSAAAGLAHLVPMVQNAARSIDGEDRRMRTAGSAIGIADSVASACAEAQGNASQLVDDADNLHLTSVKDPDAEGFGSSGETTLRLSLECRGKNKEDKAVTLMLYQARKMDVNVPGVQVEAAASKRLVQVNFLPTFGVEFPGA